MGRGADAGARARLQRRAAELRRTLATMEDGYLDRSLKDSVAELSTYDNHPADLATETWKRTQALALRSTLAHNLTEVGEALRRVADGTYGRCAACGGRIPEERLEARPEARLCVRCQEGAEARREIDGASEADVLDRGNAQNDGSSQPRRMSGDETSVDADWSSDHGLDIWEMLAMYGSSDTPSDVPQAHRDVPHPLSGLEPGELGEGLDHVIDPRGAPDDAGGS